MPITTKGVTIDPNLMRLIFLFSYFLGLNILAAEPIWQGQASEHFEIFASTGHLSGALIAGLEDIPSKLQIHMTIFNPWTHKEKITIYIYPDEAAYLNGQFHPPPWSLGIAMAKSRTIAVYQQTDTRKFKSIVLHEITHLLFQDYFGEKPPRWLTEGYAMLMENETLLNLKTVSRARSLMEKNSNTPDPRWLPLTQFFQESPTTDTPESRTGLWYKQAKSLVGYLYKSQKSERFKEFCSKLKQDTPLDEALNSAYNLKDVKALEKAWSFYLKAQKPL